MVWQNRHVTSVKLRRLLGWFCIHLNKKTPFWEIGPCKFNTKYDSYFQSLTPTTRESQNVPLRKFKKLEQTSTTYPCCMVSLAHMIVSGKMGQINTSYSFTMIMPKHSHFHCLLVTRNYAQELFMWNKVIRDHEYTPV